MKRIVLALMVLLLFCGQAVAGGGIDGFLGSLNIQARADMNGFSAKVSAQFGVPEAQVRTVIGTVAAPADAFMVFQLGQMTRKPPETVVRVYQANRGKGWGVIAKSLGIKPGSAEFHALRRGDLVFTGQPGANAARAAGKGSGKGAGKGRGKADD